MICRLCHSPDLTPLPFDVPVAAGVWLRCSACGSDTPTHGYDPAMYGPDYVAAQLASAGGLPGQAKQLSGNLDWFGHHHDARLPKDFLDVGCCEGGALYGMAERGWAVHGFDVQRSDYFGPHVTVSPFFCEWHFPRRYAAVLCREVVEHVPDPARVLIALHAVTIPGGLVQVQTPKTTGEFNVYGHQRQHLFVASAGQFRRMLGAAMLDVIEFREWSQGMAALCRARE